jgi:tRNA(Ser,Leu) C12 N-acetylase TAN1
MPESFGTAPTPRHKAADWNAVVTLPEATYREARKILAKWGSIRRTHYFNVLALTVADTARFLREFEEAVSQSPGILNVISHVVPAEAGFEFHDAAEFETQARLVALGWTARLAGKRFHVRLHRRGFKGVLSTQQEERFLDEALLAALEANGTPGKIGFDDPDAVIQIETIDGRAGMSLWTREDLQRCRFLGAD